MNTLIRRLASSTIVVLGGFSLTACGTIDPNAMGSMALGLANVYSAVQTGRAAGGQAAAMSAQAELLRQQAAAQALQNQAMNRPVRRY